MTPGVDKYLVLVTPGIRTWTDVLAGASYLAVKCLIGNDGVYSFTFDGSNIFNVKCA